MSFLPKTVLITGSSGRIGSFLAAYLNKECRVIGVDTLAGPFTTHRADITIEMRCFV